MDQLIAPIIPSSATSSRTSAPSRSSTPRALPLPTIPIPPTPIEGVVYGMGRIDASGRIGDRTITRALGWQPGDRLTMTAPAGLVLVHRDPTGMVTLGTKPYIAIPMTLRRRHGLRAGDRMLLVATPTAETLAVYPPATVDQAIRSLDADIHDPTGPVHDIGQLVARLSHTQQQEGSGRR